MLIASRIRLAAQNKAQKGKGERKTQNVFTQCIEYIQSIAIDFYFDSHKKNSIKIKDKLDSEFLCRYGIILCVSAFGFRRSHVIWMNSSFSMIWIFFNRVAVDIKPSNNNHNNNIEPYEELLFNFCSYSMNILSSTRAHHLWIHWMRIDEVWIAFVYTAVKWEMEHWRIKKTKL